MPVPMPRDDVASILGNSDHGGKEALGQPHNSTNSGRCQVKGQPGLLSHHKSAAFLSSFSCWHPLPTDWRVYMQSVPLCFQAQLTSPKVMPPKCGFWLLASLEQRNSESLPPSNLRLSPCSPGVLQTGPQSLPLPLS